MWCASASWARHDSWRKVELVELQGPEGWTGITKHYTTFRSDVVQVSLSTLESGSENGKKRDLFLVLLSKRRGRGACKPGEIWVYDRTERDKFPVVQTVKFLENESCRTLNVSISMVVSQTSM